MDLCWKGMGGSLLSDVMSTELFTTKPDDKISTLAELFKEHTGLPVLDEEQHLIGVISRRDVKDVDGNVRAPVAFYIRNTLAALVQFLSWKV